MVGMDTTGVRHESPSCSERCSQAPSRSVARSWPTARVTDLNLEQAISQDSKLRQSANVQVVRDLRTLREAALILDANKHTAECERLVTVVRELVADPAHTIETSSDTDEDKAEALDETRRRKTAALKKAAQ